MHYATICRRGNRGDRRRGTLVRWPGAPAAAERACDRRRNAGAGGRGGGRAHGPAGRCPGGRRHADRLPALLRYGEPVRGDGRTHPDGGAAAVRRGPTGGRPHAAGAGGRRPARRLLRAHRAVQARGQLPALAVALSAPGPRAARQRAPCRPGRVAARGPAGARGDHERARAGHVVRGLGSPPHRATPLARTRAGGGRTRGALSARRARRRKREVPPMNDILRIVGMPGSPYSRKLRAVLRYRRIPHAWIHHGSPEARGLPQARPALLPPLLLSGPDGALEPLVDSTPLIRRLERMYAGRAVVPPDPVVAFVDALLEDYADEWLTKAMFHYRWAYAPDIARAAAILPRWSRTDLPETELLAFGEMFAERQMGRLGVVGSNDTTAPVIEESYRRLLRLLDAHLTGRRFVMGGRPGASDFGLYGQLTQLAGFDPTPAAIAQNIAPRLIAWVDVIDDLSGLEPTDDDWRADVPDTLRALLAEVGRVYAPFLVANADAIARGAERVECTIDGRPWRQRPFPYQAKCLQWLRADHVALAPADRRAVDELLRGTGCERLFTSQQ